MVLITRKKRSQSINFLLALFIFIGFLVLIISFTQAVEEVNSIFSGDTTTERILNSTSDTLNVGRNIVVFDDYINVKDLVNNNPKIETVSYYDSFNQETIGYINFFGGIGKDFLIVPGNQYEIFVKDQLDLKL